ncbi:MAG: hypothetical protein V1907_03730 [Candidatus Kerfeldbacteria bacterium]
MLKLVLFLVVVVAILVLIVRTICQSFLDRCPACEKGRLHFVDYVTTSQGKAARFPCDRCGHVEFISTTSREMGF